MKTILALVTILAFSAPAVAQKAPTPVQFKPGATSTMLKGKVKGDASAQYAMDVVAGQTVQMLFSPSNRACYFNVTEKGVAEAIHIGSTSGNEFGRNVTASATYTIDVYLMRSAARRNETCSYKLSIEATGAPGGASAGVSDQMMRDACKGATAPMYGVEPRNVTATAPIKKSKDGFTLDGTIDKGKEGVKKMRCIFKADRTMDRVMAMTPDGE